MDAGRMPEAPQRRALEKPRDDGLPLRVHGRADGVPPEIRQGRERFQGEVYFLPFLLPFHRLLKLLLISLQPKVPHIKSCDHPCVKIPPMSQVTDWLDRQGVSGSVSITFRDGPEACTITQVEGEITVYF